MGIGVVAASLATACVQPTNPLDPDTPLQNQARATLRGTAQAVFALNDGEVLIGPTEDGQTLVEAAFCDAREGDHSGFDVVLREQGSTDGNPLVGRTQQSNASGEFVFEGVPPGNYVLQILRPGFAVPPPQPLLLRPSEDVTLDPLCGLNQTPPERPAIGPLPTVVDGTNVAAGAPAGTPPPTIDILNCQPGVRYRIDQRPESAASVEEDLSVIIDPAEGDACSVALAFFDVNGAQARETWRVSATSVDPLGNESETVSAFIVRDTLAPAPPEDLATQVGRDRVFLSWTQTPVADDDQATSWLVSYGLTARPQATDAACPYGAPLDDRGDAFDTSSFAVQGRSPIAVGEIGTTLSGILEGTTLFLQVAAKDAAGNRSCWSAPVAVRPDVVAPALAGADETTTTGVVASFFGRDAIAFARGSSGLLARLPGGDEVELAGVPALDVAGMGRELFVANGATGLQRSTLLADGQVTTVDISSVGTVNSVATVPGLVVGGTPTGFVAFAPDAPESATVFDPTCEETAVTDLVIDDDVLLAIREDSGTAVLQVTHRSELDCASDRLLLDQVPDALLLRGDELWVLAGNRLTGVGFGACRVPAGFAPETCCADAPASGCLEETFSTTLSAQAQGQSLTAWDDLVLIGASGGSLPSAGVLVLEPQPSGPPLTSGIAFTGQPSPVFAVEPRDGGFCALSEEARTCFDTVSGPLAEAPQRLTSSRAGSVEVALPTNEKVLLFSTGPTGVLDGIESSTDGAVPENLQALPDDAPAVAPADILRRIFPANTLDAQGAVVTLDTFGQLYSFSPSRTSDTLRRIDIGLPGQVATLWPNAAHPTEGTVLSLTDGLVDTDGDAIVVFAANRLREEDGCSPAAVLKISIVTDIAGQQSVGAVEGIDLGPWGRPTALTVDNGRAYLASEPYRVDVLNLDTMTLASAPAFGGDLVCTGNPGGALAFGASVLQTFASRRVLSAGTTLVDGTPRNVLEVEAGEFVFGGLAEVTAANTVGRFVALAAASGEVLLYDVGDAAAGTELVPTLSLPTGTRPLTISASRRGVVFADGPAGAVRHILR